MENVVDNIEKLYTKAEKYSKTSIELIKLNAIDKTSDIISSLAVVITISLIVAMFTLFVNIGISLLIGKMLNDYYLGFFIVSGFYVFFGIVIYCFRTTFIKIPIDNLIVSKLLKDKEYPKKDSDI
ncbi:hypothetical protein OX283_013695 [Flavobacterium sp. SUN052]|uniref:hypothetical protein n=1 Tax=Flavobacterium sp. SUN052 TaxID=3002441 RepID=UPI00237D43A6|nr:hypothetical protein [Flavobacterium sp. SUN052]MEC4005719.1 hypothetical protein [Flavobacterium sp. SUN052]